MKRPGLFRSLLVLAGILVIAYLVAHVGPDLIWDAFRTLSWRLLLVLVFPSSLAVVADTLGWRFTFPRAPHSFGRLVTVRMAGEAVNLVTTGAVGGDLLKAYLLRPGVALREGLASVIADKTTSVVSQVLMLLVGVAIGAFLVPKSNTLLLTMTASLVIEVACVVAFVVVQLRGVVGGGGRLLARLRFPPSREHQAVLDGTDRILRSLYAEHSRGLLASLLCHLMGFALGTLEIYLVVRFLDVPISFPAAFAIGAFSTAVKFFTFMVPASLGALEGGYVAIFSAFGMGGAVALTYTLVRRLREILWVGAGFVVSSVASLPVATAPEPADRSGIVPP
ncbi:MAG TPA: flippase-like domain-containing protein [Candidatus Methylomirabilis sp.]|nr:flippase-like domain-containing protein [Candidatus Methylomirabilis sp.]